MAISLVRAEDMEGTRVTTVATGHHAVEAKVLRWARVFQPLIPVLDVLRNNGSGRGVGAINYGDGYDHGDGDGRNQHRGRLHREGDGIGNGDNHRSRKGNGSSLVNKDGNGTVIRH
jgi:hypothetical protein